MCDRAPLISIVTATFNAADALSFTARSLEMQSFRSFEWIVIDGGSKDATIDVIRNLGALVHYWVSEPDQGIYDAWNKAVRVTRGQWLIFLGAGDELAAADVLDQIAKVLASAYPAYEVVYGKVELISERKRLPIVIVDKPWDSMRGSWTFFRPSLPVHPETFQHRSLFLGDQPFDLRFKIGSDTHFLLRAFQKKDPLYVPILIDRMPIGGMTSRPENLWKMAKEIRAINKDLDIHPPLMHVIAESIKLVARLAIGVVPDRAYPWVMDGCRVILGRKGRHWSVDRNE